MISDIVAIGGLCTTALSVVAIVALAYKLIEAVASERAAMSAETLAEKAQQGAEFARDAALAAQKKAEAERGDALAKLEATEKRLNAALGKEADEGAAKVAAEPTAGAAGARQDWDADGGGHGATSRQMDAASIHARTPPR